MEHLCLAAYEVYNFLLERRCPALQFCCPAVKLPVVLLLLLLLLLATYIYILLLLLLLLPLLFLLLLLFEYIVISSCVYLEIWNALFFYSWGVG